MTLRALALVLLLAVAVCGQAPQAQNTAKAAEDLAYSVKVKSDSRFGRGKKRIIEFTVANQGTQPVTLAFAGSERVCGEFHDPDDQRYFEFGAASKEPAGTEIFVPGKKTLFRREIPLDSLPKEPAGRNSVAAWLCGYGVQRAWGEFPLYGKPKQEK